jgi:hypothetical protein
MKSFWTALVCCCFVSFEVAAQAPVRYSVAHTRSRNVDMVLVKVGARFFEADTKTQARWFTDIQACARGAKLGGTVVAVATINGGFRYYGPKSWHNFLGTIDMAWVNARVNKEMICRF